jgi:hypothetical protein
LLALSKDLPRLWNHPAASTGTRKRILRALLNEIVVTVEADRLHLLLHWQDCDHTRLEVAKNRTGELPPTRRRRRAYYRKRMHFLLVAWLTSASLQT